MSGEFLYQYDDGFKNDGWTENHVYFDSDGELIFNSRDGGCLQLTAENVRELYEEMKKVFEPQLLSAEEKTKWFKELEKP